MRPATGIWNSLRGHRPGRARPCLYVLLGLLLTPPVQSAETEAPAAASPEATLELTRPSSSICRGISA